MSAASNYLENKLLDHFLGTAEFTMPNPVYCSLHSADPAEDASGAEISGNGYARQQMDFDAASAGSAANSADTDFTASGGSWPTITHWAIWDAPSGGNMLVYGAFAASRDIADTETFRIDAGDIVVNAS